MNSSNSNDKKYLIDPKRFRTNNKMIKLIVVFWLFWTPATIVMTYYAVSTFNIYIYLWLIIGYIGVLYIPYLLFNSKRTQLFSIENDNLVIFGRGILLTSKIQISKNDIKELALIRGLDDDGQKYANRKIELSFFNKGKLDKISFAHFVHVGDQQIIFDELIFFLKKHGFLIETKLEMPMGNNLE